MSNEKDIKTVDGAVETAKEIMTTEIFHAQLVKNTEACLLYTSPSPRD